MLEIVDGVAFTNDDIDLDDVNFDIVTFFRDDMVHDIMDLNYINLDDNNFHDDPETIIHVRLMAWCNRYKQYKAFKIEIIKELMPVLWYPTRWWDWCVSEDEKKL